jgi:hypothetical protein
MPKEAKLNCPGFAFASATSLHRRMGGQDARRLGEQRYGIEGFARVVGQLCEHRRIDGVGHGRHQQRVTVGRGARQQLGRDDVRGAGPIVHDHLLPEGLAHALRQEARDEVRSPARGERHEEADRAVGIAGILALCALGLRIDAGGQQQCRQ